MLLHHPSLYGDASQIILADEFDTWKNPFCHDFSVGLCCYKCSLSLSPLMHFTSSPDGRPLALLVVNRTW